MSGDRPSFEPPGWRCTKRPNRTRPREFTCRDVERIARKALARSPRACVAVAALSATGYLETVCDLFGWLDTIVAFERRYAIRDMLRGVKRIFTIIVGILQFVGGTGAVLRAIAVLELVDEYLGLLADVVANDELFESLVELRLQMCNRRTGV